jgi:hypothetical protein
MRYPAPEKLEIIQLVEQSPLPVRLTLTKFGIAWATFYRWYDRHNRGGPEALNDRSPRPDRVWNRIPNGVRDKCRENRPSPFFDSCHHSNAVAHRHRLIADVATDGMDLRMISGP